MSIMINSKLKLDMLFKKSNLTFLVGAGCSIDAPSHMMAGKAMMNTIIKYTCADSEIDRMLELIELRFEQLLEIIRNNLDGELKIIDYYSQCDKPNIIHFFLAEMIKKGHFVLTTNFDFLLEHALLQSNVPKDEIKCVITKTDYENSGNPANLFKNGIKPIYKIHGSTENIITGENTKPSLITTMQSFGSNKEGLGIFQVEPYKKPLFDNVSNQRTLIILGYSGGDAFDIIPTIKGLKNLKYLIWINHINDDKEKIKVLRIEPPKYLSLDQYYEYLENNRSSSIEYMQKLNLLPGTELADMMLKNVKAKEQRERITNIFIDIAKMNNVDDYNIYRIDTNTSRLIKKLFKKMGLKKPELSPDNFSLNLTDWLKKKIKAPDDFKKYKISYDIYLILSKIQDAVRCGNKMLSIAEETRDQSLKMMALRYMGDINYLRNDLDNALKSYIEALKLATGLNAHAERARMLYGIALALKKQNRFLEALECIEKCYLYYEKSDDHCGRARCCITYGDLLCCGNMYKQAGEIYERALTYYNESGDLLEKATCYFGIGQVYYEFGKKAKALDTWEAALEIVNILNDITTIKILDLLIRHYFYDETNKEIKDRMWAILLTIISLVQRNRNYIKNTSGDIEYWAPVLNKDLNEVKRSFNKHISTMKDELKHLRSIGRDKNKKIPFG